MEERQWKCSVRSGKGSVTVQGRWDGGVEGGPKWHRRKTEEVGPTSGMPGRICH